MADFLANLAARSLGQLPSVQPRRASRFEGDPAMSGDGLLEALDLEAEIPARQMPPPPRGRLEQPHEGAELDEQPPGAPPRGTEIYPDPAPDVPASLDPEPAGELPRLEVSIEGHPDAGPVRPLHVAVEIPESHAHSEGIVDTDQHVEPQPVPPQARLSRQRDLPEHFASRAPDRHETLADAIPAIDAKDEDRTEAAQASPADVVRLTTRVAMPEAEQAGDAPRRDSSTAPTVSVSIGRIEVKVAQAPEPARPAQQPARPKPQPGISLGEYLERSLRGRR